MELPKESGILFWTKENAVGELEMEFFTGPGHECQSFRALREPTIRKPLIFLAQIVLLLEPKKGSYQSSPILIRPFPEPTDERKPRATWWKEHYL